MMMMVCSTKAKIFCYKFFENEELSGYVGRMLDNYF